MSFPFIVQGSNIIVVIDNQSFTINKSHIAYEKIREAIKTGDWDTVRDCITPKKVIINYGAGNISIQGEEVFWKGAVMHNSLTRRLVQMFQEGFPIEPLVLFMENLMQNPSKRSVDELYSFLEKGNLPITPDGHFLAYKKVRENYLDVHSGTISNHVGAVVEMERNQVDDDRQRTCSTGLHFCSQSYLANFGGERTMILKINPRDVVSIPSDYNDSKGRCCRYEVIGELGVSAEQAFTEAVQDQANGVTDNSWPFPCS